MKVSVYIYPYFPYFPPQGALQFANISRITFSSEALQVKRHYWLAGRKVYGVVSVTRYTQMLS